MKVLVTGVSGHVGKYVGLELVGHGHDVCGVDVRAITPEMRAAGVSMVYTDIGDPLPLLSLLDGVDAVVHCGAYPGPSGRTAAEMMRVNVIGTQNILEAAMANGVGRVIVTSSVGALGYSFPEHPCLPDYFPVDALHPRRPQDIYGLTKLMNEESAAAATRRTGITTIVIRPPWVVNLEKMARQSWLKWRIDESSERRRDDLWGYIDVHDLAVAYRLAIEAEITGHSVFFVMADDVLANYDAPELIRRYYSDRIADIEKLTGRSLYDLTPARDILGFQSTHTWRDHLSSQD